MDVNVTGGAFLCCRAVAPVMRRQQTGRIINISSATVLGGRPDYLHYVTSKAPDRHDALPGPRAGADGG